MRINKFVATATGMSRRSADKAIEAGEILVNGSIAAVGHDVTTDDHVTMAGRVLSLPDERIVIMLNKPVGYVCSRNGQGSRTIYELLPEHLRGLKTVGRLDKESSGLLLLTDDGDLANRLTHPRYGKLKIYSVALDKDLKDLDKRLITSGVRLSDGPSTLTLKRLSDSDKRRT